jgi:diguanylate cyclase (GGDEF)-like protein
MTKLVEARGVSKPRGERAGRFISDARFDILLRIIKTANDQLDPSRVLRIIMDNIQKLIPCEAWSILLITSNGDELRFERARGQAASHLTKARLKIGQGIAGWVAQHRKPAIVNRVDEDKRFEPQFDHDTHFKTRSILCVPLISRNRLLGVVELINRKSTDLGFSREDLKTLIALLGPISVSLHNALLFKEIGSLAVTDDLTRLHNSRYVNNFVETLIQRTRKKNGQFSVIFLDVDGMKTVVDRYGHLIGGRTLVEIGKIISRSTRKKDKISRYGGDEFIVILPNAGAAEAVSAAEKIRVAIQDYDFMQALQKEIRLSASFGVAVFPDHGETVTELIQKADQAMYRVKYSGKNAVQLAQ